MKNTLCQITMVMLVLVLAGCYSPYLGSREHIGPAEMVATASRDGAKINVVIANHGAGEGHLSDPYVHAYNSDDERVTMTVYETDLDTRTLRSGEVMQFSVFEDHPQLNAFDYVVVGLKWFNHEVDQHRGPLWEHRQIRIDL